MKRLVAAALILVGLFVAMWAHLAALEYLTGYMIEQLHQVDACLLQQDWEGTNERLDEIEAVWERKALYLHSTLPHCEIDEVTTTIQEIRAYLSSGEDRGECYALAARLRAHLQLLLEDERPTVENLL